MLETLNANIIPNKPIYFILEFLYNVTIILDHRTNHLIDKLYLTSSNPSLLFTT